MKESLIIWCLNSSGESIPMVHNRVLSLLEAVNPGKWGQDVLDLLMSEGWVKCTVYGTYELTPDGVKERKKLPDALEAPIYKKPVPQDVAPWETFRKIVGYYADCVKQQERSQEYLFDGDYGKKYFLPVMPYGWLTCLGEESKEVSVAIDKTNLVAVGTILARKSYEEDVYIGYPIESFYSKGHTHHVPITLIPVDVRNDSTRLYIKLRTDEASINHSWLEYHVPQEDHKTLLDILTRIHHNDEYCGLIDVKKSLPYLERYARGCQPGMFESDDLTWVLPRLEKKGSVPCNCAALFVGRNLQYSKTLVRELRYIANVSDEVLDKTALAYVFREPRLKPMGVEPNYAYPFIKTNDEQQLAVTESMNKPVTLVTGPPGTGKSQVAVNIIANYVFRGKSVLFTSKNHKAVHAIADRSASLLSGHGVDLVNFCSTPDGQVTEEWFKKDIELMLSRMEQAREGGSRWHYDDAVELEHKWNDVSLQLSEREELETGLSLLQARVEELEMQLRRFVVARNRTQEVVLPEIDKLKSIVSLLSDKPTGNGLKRWWAEMMWRIRGRRRDEAGRLAAAKIVPSKVNPAISSSYIKDELKRFIDKSKQFKQLRIERESYQKRCESLIPLSFACECLHDDVVAVDGKLVSALLHKITENAQSFLADEEMLKQLKNLQASYPKRQSVSLLLSSADAEREQEEILKFERFLKIAPAWATTLLSLTRSAPCLPGVFDAVIIDEASQCDVPPMIPALYRAKRAIIVGDPQQFPPVISMREARNEYLRKLHHVSEVKYAIYDYCHASAYSVVPEKRIMLTNHYRCHPDIAEYFNDAFYNNRLNVCTLASSYGLKQAVDWVEVSDSVDREMDAVVERVAELAKNCYKGSVGVVTPLRKYANILDERLNKYRKAFDGELIVNTVNAFQGGEKDVIIFMLSYTSQLAKSQLWYLTAESNRYIYNVAVSRARACLVLVGDKRRCAESNFVLLRKLASIPKIRQKNSDIPSFDSIWEERFYHELVKAGIKPETQYHLVGRRLDMALITENVKLDIEVDGVRWHTSASGGRKVDDLWRDIQIESAGWHVLRFWVYELENDMPACVQRVREAIESA